jgi:hypothetical protein
VKIQIPMMIQDPKLSRYSDIERVVQRHDVFEDFFLNGPVSRRVAVLDFDPYNHGALADAVPFQPPKGGQTLWRYGIDDVQNVLKPGFDVYAPDFMAVSAFGTVLKTIDMFEEEDTLGRDRRVTWAFESPQLLIIPRAGQWANAFYERASHSLQFFYFPNPNDRDDTVYTCLSRDIVAHETGHAILDAIVPRLYDAITPESLALHEGIADLTALLMTFRSGVLRRAVLEKTKGSIAESNAFSSIAEEYGMARYPRLGYLRNLDNRKKMDEVDQGSPHALSQVLSGALYQVMLKMYERWWREFSGGEPGAAPDVSKSGGALGVAARQFKRMIVRALDYLPPAEVSYADYGRAIIAADQASHPDDTQEREWIREEFVERKMVPGPEALQVATAYEAKELQGVDLEALVHSDWAAYDFANRHRGFLHIPRSDQVTFHIRPRFVVERTYYHRGRGAVPVKELIFKVWWDRSEANPVGGGLPRRRQYSVGTTLVVDLDTGRVRALLTTDRQDRLEEQRQQRERRNLLLHRLAGQDLLRFGQLALGPDGTPLRSFVQAQASGDLMRVRGTARMLHIVREV